jgi:hypothetical protein
LDTTDPPYALVSILKRFGGRLARYANIDNFLKTSSAKEEDILASVALPYVVQHTLGHPIRQCLVAKTL